MAVQLERGIEDAASSGRHVPRGRDPRVGPGWAIAAIGSLIALAAFAPSGLYLIGFLGLIIVAHEGGHYVLARRAGMRPTEFYWGFGPEICSIRVDDCRFGVRVLFLGGYVRLEGMTPRSELPDGFPESGTFRAATVGGRLSTILAGPAVNLVMAWLAFTAAVVIGGGSVLTAPVDGLGDVWFVLAATAEALWLWVDNLGGYLMALADTSGRTEPPVRFLSPVAQADVSRQAVGQGLASSLQWFGILSSAIGAINLLPLPPLDGSHAAAAAGEGTIRRLTGRNVRLDVTRLVPLAYLTVGILVALSVSALVLDLRDLA
ncbi:MAG: site-2 protease family protein [Actinomycetota bacterium]